VPLYDNDCTYEWHLERAAYEMGVKAARTRMIDHPQGDHMHFDEYIILFMKVMRAEYLRDEGSRKSSGGS